MLTKAPAPAKWAMRVVSVQRAASAPFDPMRGDGPDSVSPHSHDRPNNSATCSEPEHGPRRRWAIHRDMEALAVGPSAWERFTGSFGDEAHQFLEVGIWEIHPVEFKAGWWHIRETSKGAYWGTTLPAKAAEMLWAGILAHREAFGDTPLLPGSQENQDEVSLQLL